jgi:hypothetical protein
LTTTGEEMKIGGLESEGKSAEGLNGESGNVIRIVDKTNGKSEIRIIFDGIKVVWFNWGV